MIRLTALIVTLVALGTASYAGTDVSVPHFFGISVHSGANVKLIYGPTQRVTLIRGDLRTGRIQVKDGKTLEISGCEGFCWGNHPFEVEVVTPKIDAVVAHRGADVKASGAFPRQLYLYVQAHSGADVDLSAVPADTADVVAHSGGEAHVKALWKLNAKAHSGGDIRYSGHPAHINSQANSGGEVSGD